MTRQDAKEALRRAAIRVVVSGGPRAATARAIAAEAGLAQGLVFYHFGGVEPLLREAYDVETRAMVADFEHRLAEVTTFAQLHAVGIELAEQAKESGNAALLAHTIAAAHNDPEQAQLLQHSLGLWRDVVGVAVNRILGAQGLERVVDAEALTAALAASTIGMVTLDTITPAPLGSTLGAVDGVAGLVDRVLRLVPGPLVRRLLRPRRVPG